jgi:aldehyde:ferredoxin oxidoreductase
MGKAKVVTWMENFKAVVDSVGICALLSWWKSPHLIGPEDIARLLEAATGRHIDVRELMRMPANEFTTLKGRSTRESG